MPGSAKEASSTGFARPVPSASGSRLSSFRRVLDFPAVAGARSCAEVPGPRVSSRRGGRMRSMLLALLFIVACGDDTIALSGSGSYHVVDLGDLGRTGNSGAWGINSAGYIVGESATLSEG